MPDIERSFSDVLQDIVHNLQDIIRYEVRLAKMEVRDDLGKTGAAAFLLGIGALSGVFGIFFILLAIVHALSFVVPEWAAALIVAVALAFGAAIAITGGIKRFKQVNAAPKTIQSLKENVEWAKRQTK